MKKYTIMYRIGKRIRVDETYRFESLDDALRVGRERVLNELLNKDVEEIRCDESIEVVGVFES